MTAPADLMEQLRAAWTASGTARTTEPADPPTEKTRPKGPGADAVRPVSLKLSFPTCESHLDPTGWRREPVPDRPGWLLTTCARCGRFIGYGHADNSRDITG